MYYYCIFWWVVYYVIEHTLKTDIPYFMEATNLKRQLSNTYSV